jgi:hypothetical protein
MADYIETDAALTDFLIAVAADDDAPTVHLEAEDFVTADDIAVAA